MNSGKLAMNLLMLAIFVGMVGVASQYPPQARFMPLVVGLPGIGLCLLQLVLDWRAQRATGNAAATADLQGTPEAHNEQARAAGRERALWGWFIGLVASLVLFGFWLTIPVFLVAFLRYAAKESWRFSLALGAGGTAAFTLVFHQVLAVVLHSGFITDLVVDRFFAA